MAQRTHQVLTGFHQALSIWPWLRWVYIFGGKVSSSDRERAEQPRLTRPPVARMLPFSARVVAGYAANPRSMDGRARLWCVREPPNKRKRAHPIVITVPPVLVGQALDNGLLCRAEKACSFADRLAGRFCPTARNPKAPPHHPAGGRSRNWTIAS